MPELALNEESRANTGDAFLLAGSGAASRPSRIGKSAVVFVSLFLGGFVMSALPTGSGRNS